MVALKICNPVFTDIFLTLSLSHKYAFSFLYNKIPEKATNGRKHIFCIKISDVSVNGCLLQVLNLCEKAKQDREYVVGKQKAESQTASGLPPARSHRIHLPVLLHTK